MLSLPEIARAVNGKVRGRYVLAPGPGHSRKDESLLIELSDTLPDGFRVHTFSPGDDWRVCRDHVGDLLGLPRGGWRERVEPDPAEVARRRRLRREAEAQERARVARRQRLAVETWRAAREPRGTMAALFYRTRGLDIAADIAGSALRFHPHCPWGEETAPAIIAPLRCIRTGDILGIHRTALDAHGRKIGRRMLGTASGCAIMLDPFAGGDGFLTIGEGIETTLTARQHLGFRPAWALGSSGAIAALPVVDGVHTLIVLGERDPGGASAAAIEQVSARWYAAGRNVEILWPPEEIKDLNDLIREDAPACP